MQKTLKSISIIVPHLRLTTGGVYSMYNYVKSLSATLKVNLLSLAQQSEGSFDVSARHIKQIDDDTVPDADAIILNADSPYGQQFIDLSHTKGRKILYFQGFGSPNNPIVWSNIERDCRIIASSRWLTDLAKKIGRASIYVPYGIDRQIFYARRQPEFSDNRMTVALMTHPVDWKGTSDGLEALRLAAASEKNFRIRLFGHRTDQFKEAALLDLAEFVEKPGRTEVGEILRSSNIYLCSSWEEGFGMPGLEALACGAALVTTDTKGSRDYAIDGETALVSPPHRPDMLAKNISATINNADLRRRLARAGVAAADRFPTWAQSAKLFQSAIEELIA